MSESGTEQTPALRVVRGRPTAEELAALVVALGTLAADQPAPPPPAEPSAWADRARALRAPLMPGPGAWQASAREV